MPKPKKEVAKVPCTADPVAICPLVNNFASEDGTVREKARQFLVAMGPAVTIPLLEALNDKRASVRWEAAKALGKLADPSTASALVRLLQDPDFDVRWVAGEALAAMKRKALEPLLWALVQHAEVQTLREGAQHIIRKLAAGDLKPVLMPVVEALDFQHPEVTVPPAALKALDNLAKGVGQSKTA